MSANIETGDGGVDFLASINYSKSWTRSNRNRSLNRYDFDKMFSTSNRYRFEVSFLTGGCTRKFFEKVI